jgi:uncharacterized membrane protein
VKGRGLQILLICSLVLNVFVVGALAGAAMMWHRVEAQRQIMGGPGFAGGRAGRLRQAAMNLSPKYRRELRHTLVETLEGLQPQIAEARAMRLEASRLLDEPRLDKAALQTALDKARGADMTIRTRLESAVVEFAASLPEAERSALAQGLAMPGTPMERRP